MAVDVTKFILGSGGFTIRSGRVPNPQLPNLCYLDHSLLSQLICKPTPIPTPNNIPKRVFVQILRFDIFQFVPFLLSYVHDIKFKIFISFCSV
ncbi:hypothetical protein RchiOBHm_Chr1g0352181 [Rosa chinensis]|uniref:Uncharacterized protein n=1 Tax=Rosa chinensis TaxID=74649 RepID=A0A2P6SGJ5_ROSCH|nr:hypothetical protein RchiOBHm_Chr1g0352181 [Rosa chinensis]